MRIPAVTRESKRFPTRAARPTLSVQQESRAGERRRVAAVEMSAKLPSVRFVSPPLTREGSSHALEIAPFEVRGCRTVQGAKIFAGKESAPRSGAQGGIQYSLASMIVSTRAVTEGSASSGEWNL